MTYGAQPDYNGAEPTKTAAGYTYAFAGWSTNPTAATGAADTALPAVTDDVVYHAIFTETANTYTVTWMNAEAQLERDTNVTYGAQPDYNGAEPMKTQPGTLTPPRPVRGLETTNPESDDGIAVTALPDVTG